MEELLKSLDHPLFGAKVTDPLVKQLADFVYLQCNLTNVEIEAKFGWCIDKATQQRISLPVLTDTVLSMPGDPAWYRFESNMSLEQHRHFNQAFNRLVTTPSGAKMTYKHTREVDEFFNVQGRRIRVTRNKNTNEVLSVIEKSRVADLHLHLPMLPFDCRITVSREVPATAPEHLAPAFTRQKDRLSYRHDVFQYDLTQVKTSMGPGRPDEVTHELEMEVSRMDLVLALRERLDRGDRDGMRQFWSVMEGMVKRIREVSTEANRVK